MSRHLTRVLPFVFCGAFVFSAALAQEVRVTAKLFVSPSGEPFRAKASEPYPLGVWFTKIDTDGDGKISHEAFMADAMAYFSVLDQNKDGLISAAENAHYEARILPEMLILDPRVAQPKNYRANQEMSSPTDDPTRGRYQRYIQGASQYSLIDEPQPIRAADADFNYRITEDEWQAISEQRFILLDVNQDNLLSLDELPKTPLQFALDNPPKAGEAGGKPKEKKGGLFGGRRD